MSRVSFVTILNITNCIINVTETEKVRTNERQYVTSEMDCDMGSMINDPTVLSQYHRRIEFLG